MTISDNRSPGAVFLTNISTDGTNPWLSMWQRACEESGVVFKDLNRRNLIGPGVSPPDGVHLQWPEHVTNAASLREAMRKTAALLVKVLLARVRGVPVILTVHNVRSHHGSHKLLEEFLWFALSHLVTDVHSLSRAGRDEIVARIPALEARRWHVIPHGTYEPVLEELPEQSRARQHLGLPREAKIALAFGALKRYKGVDELLPLLGESPSCERTIIALVGSPQDVDFKQELEDKATSNPGLVLDLRFQSLPELVSWIRASDVVVLPYRKVLNSGSALLALSCGRPVLLPATATFAELADDVGHDWVKTYEGRLRSTDLWSACAVRPISAAPDLKAHDWAGVRAAIGQLVEVVKRNKGRRMWADLRASRTTKKPS